MMSALKIVLTSHRIRPNKDRQVRLWSGSARDNSDFKASFEEIVELYTPEKSSATNSTREFEGRPAREYNPHFGTHNFAFSHNLPRFDVRPRLGRITAPTLSLSSDVTISSSQ